MNNMNEYLNEKIKDEQAISMVKSMLKKDGLVKLDFKDVKSILDTAKETTIFSGIEEDIEKISHSNYSGALFFMEGPTGMTLDQTKWIVEKICDKIDEDATIIWGAKINEKAEKITFTAVFVKKEDASQNEST